eukprot:SAG11_NODE_10_length_27955_cov_15.365235_11_plen_138_part_00
MTTGILTAGALWTPLHDAQSFEDNLQSLIRQIYKSVVPDEDGEATFSIEDVKGELERMRDSDSEVRSATAAAAGGIAMVPATVPKQVVGLRVTSEMRQLLDLLLDSISSRVGFVGMGGLKRNLGQPGCTRLMTVAFV